MLTEPKAMIPFLMMLACASASAQTTDSAPSPGGSGIQVGNSVSAAGDSVSGAISRARQEVDSAVKGLSSARQGKGEPRLSAVHQDTLETREAKQQALRACFESLLLGEASEHELDHGDADPSL